MMTLYPPRYLKLPSLILAGSALISPLSPLSSLSPVSFSGEAHACLPELLPAPELFTATNEDGSLPQGAAIILKIDGSTQFSDVSVSVDGAEVEASVEHKWISLAALLHINLSAEAAEGSEIEVSLPNYVDNETNETGLTLTYTIGAPAPEFDATLEGINFDIINRSELSFNSCDGSPQQTNFFISGSGLDRDWLYADYVVGGERITRTIGSDSERDDLLALSLTHGDLEVMSIADASAGVTLYDAYGRSASIRTIGGCRLIDEQIDPDDFNASYSLVEQSEEGCDLGEGDYGLSDPSDPEDPDGQPDGDPADPADPSDPEDPDGEPADPSDPEDPDGGQPDGDPNAEDPDSEDPDEAGDVESEGGCDQRAVSTSTSLYLMFAGLLSLIARRRRETLG